MKSIKELETSLNKKLVQVAFFKGSDESFEAYNNALDYLKSHRYSTGSMCRNKPIGITKFGAYISKWDNLGTDVSCLDGVILSDDFREGDVSIYVSEDLVKDFYSVS